MKTLQILQSSLTDSAFRKTLSASSAKDVWDSLEKGNNEQAKLRRLEKQFEELSMDESESTVSYLDKVIEIAEQMRRLRNGKSDYEIVTRVLGSLSESDEDLATLLEENVDLKKVTLKILAEFFNRYESEKKRSQSRSRNELPVYEMNSLTLGPMTFDEDMWMLYIGTTNHMTPYVKYFTTLDRTHRAPVVLADRSVIMTEGIGDVKVMTKEGKKKKMIKNVLFVPDINRNVLSLCQLGELGYIMLINGGKCFLKGQRTGKYLGKPSRMREAFFSVIK